MICLQVHTANIPPSLQITQWWLHCTVSYGLASTVTLGYTEPYASFCVMADIFDTALVAVLHQHDGREWFHLALLQEVDAIRTAS